MPFIAGLAVTAVFAVVLVWIGVMQVIQALELKSWGGFIWQLIIGLIMLLGGIAIWIDPILGALTLTLVVAAVFVAKGVFQVILGFRMRPHRGWGWMLIAGILSVIVGLIIWLDWPVSTAWALGTLDRHLADLQRLELRDHFAHGAPSGDRLTPAPLSVRGHRCTARSRRVPSPSAPRLAPSG